MVNRQGAHPVRLGFWAVQFASGVVTICPVAAGMLSLAAIGELDLGIVLARVHTGDRARLMRAALRSMRGGDPFDLIVGSNARFGPSRRLRILGGRGYHARGHAEIHGILEEVAPAVDG